MTTLLRRQEVWGVGLKREGDGRAKRPPATAFRALKMMETINDGEGQAGVHISLVRDSSRHNKKRVGNRREWGDDDS